MGGQASQARGQLSEVSGGNYLDMRSVVSFFEFLERLAKEPRGLNRGPFDEGRDVEGEHTGVAGDRLPPIGIHEDYAGIDRESIVQPAWPILVERGVDDHIESFL